MADLKNPILNVNGNPSDDFIEEITESQTKKYNQLVFGVLVNGLAGEPTFGLGLGDLVGETNTYELVTEIRDRAREELPNLVDNIEYDGISAEQGDKYLGIDLRFTDLETKEALLLPIAV